MYEWGRLRHLGVVVGLIGFGVLSIVEIVGWVTIGIAAVLFVLAAIALVLFLSVPVQTFLRYYAFLVLGDTNADVDLIPDQRRTARG